jgi:hypothetical protein
MLRNTDMNSRRRWLMLMLVALTLVPQAFKLFLPQGQMFPAFFPDDCFYYYKTALNIATGHGSTFDGMNFTNGYHPLWMLVCVALAFVTSDPTYYLYLVLAISLVVIFCLSLRIVMLFRSTLGFWLSMLIVALMNTQRKCAGGIFSGLETPLYLWLTLETTNLLVRMSWRNKANVITLGVLGGLTFLTRTSFVLFLPALCIYLVYRYRRTSDRPSPGTLFLAAVPFFVMAGPYLAWNYYHTGFFQQISGVVKSTSMPGGFASLADFEQALVAFAGNSGFVILPLPLSGVLIAALLISAFVVWHSGRLRALFVDMRLVVLLVFAFTEATYYFASYGQRICLWHIAPATVVVYLAAAAVMSEALSCMKTWSRGKLLLAGILAVIPFLTFGQNFYYSRIYRYPPFMYDAAIWARENLPPGAVLGVWNAGIMGYFSQHPVVNLDGVINGRTLYDYRQDGRGVYRYILDQHVQYIGDYFVGPPGPEQSILRDRLKVVYSSESTTQNAGGTPMVVHYYIWKVN